MKFTIWFHICRYHRKYLLQFQVEPGCTDPIFTHFFQNVEHWYCDLMQSVYLFPQKLKIVSWSYFLISACQKFEASIRNDFSGAVPISWITLTLLLILWSTSTFKTRKKKKSFTLHLFGWKEIKCIHILSAYSHCFFIYFFFKCWEFGEMKANHVVIGKKYLYKYRRCAFRHILCRMLSLSHAKFQHYWKLKWKKNNNNSRLFGSLFGEKF